jgi:hypothetical protein
MGTTACEEAVVSIIPTPHVSGAVPSGAVRSDAERSGAGSLGADSLGAVPAAL